MCGIIAYTGTQPALPVIVEGLQRLEYRGYDSAGVAVQTGDCLTFCKASGKLSSLRDKLSAANLYVNEGPADHACQATTGIGHTRWATHGAPLEKNAHPHWDSSGTLAVVHNGIIENYIELREELTNAGYTFVSETDTETIVQLVAYYAASSSTLIEALAQALARLEGSFALTLISTKYPNTIWAARRSSPLVLGIGDSGLYLASDIPAFLAHTQQALFLDDDEILVADRKRWQLYDSTGQASPIRDPELISWDITAAEKDGYAHFMLKEIFEQPKVIKDCLSGRLDEQSGAVHIPEVAGLPIPSRIRVVACGTSFHAGLWAKYLLETWAKIPVEVEIASEFRYRRISFSADELVCAISQSGETADTLAGLGIAREQSIPILGICNVLGSSVARAADRVLYTQAGPEISVASTKAMCSQMLALTLLAIYWGRSKEVISAEHEKDIVQQLKKLPRDLDQFMPALQEKAQKLAREYQKARSFFFLGRGMGYPLALEGALKLKEISYIHAEGYAAGEMKHGPIALIEKDFPSFAIDLADGLSGKLISNLQEVRARSGPVLLLSSSAKQFEGANYWQLPKLAWPLDSFAVLPAIQLFAYEMAVLLDKDVDQPRNLAKSVTVE